MMRQADTSFSLVRGTLSRRAKTTSLGRRFAERLTTASPHSNVAKPALPLRRMLALTIPVTTTVAP
jgi:hypothetical protein